MSGQQELGHTQTPWKTDAETEHQSVLGPDNIVVADCAIFGFGEVAEKRTDAICQANAELIVRAVNERATLLSQVRQLEAEVERLKGELSQQIEKTSRALNQVDIEAERAGNFENDKDALEAQVRQKDEALRAAQTALNDWTVSHAPDMCGEASVKEAAERVGKTGTLHYIATVQEQIAAALFLTTHPDTRDEILKRINADHFMVLMEEAGLPYEGMGRAAVMICDYLEGKRALL